MEGAKGSVSGLQAAVLEFVENNGPVQKFGVFHTDFMNATQASPGTIRGTGIDYSKDERATDPFLRSHDFFNIPTRLIEIGIMHSDEIIALPYLGVGDKKKPVILATAFMGRATAPKGHMIASEVKDGAVAMKSMADFVLRDAAQKERYSVVLDTLKVIYFFQLSAIHKLPDKNEAVRSIGDIAGVYEILANLEMSGTESLTRSIYQKLFDKPETKALIGKMKVDVKTADELRTWVETSGLLTPAASAIAERLKNHIGREVVDHMLKLKKSLLEFVYSLQEKGQVVDPEATHSVVRAIAGIDGVVSKQLMRTIGTGPVITHIEEPVEEETQDELPEDMLPASVAPVSQAPMSEVPATLASPPPVFEADSFEAIVPSKIVFVGEGDESNSAYEATAGEAEILATVRAGFQYFQNGVGRAKVKIGFAHKFEFCDFLLSKDFEIGDLSWENLKDYKLAELFNSNTPAGVNGLLNFFRTMKWVREEISKKRLRNDEFVREQCSEIFTSLFK